MTGELELHGGELVSAADAEMWARLAELDAAAEQFEPRADNTLRGYASDWRAWQEYVAAEGIPLMVGTPGAFLGFVIFRARQGHAPSTIERNLYGAAVMLREHGVNVPNGAPRKAKAAIDVLTRELAIAGEERGRGQSSPLTVPQLRRMSAALPNTVKGVRDRAVLTLALGMAARRSEVAHLLARDVVVVEEGLQVRIRFGKTGGREVAIKKGENPLTCARRAWLAWSSAVELDPDGPAFHRLNRHGHLLGSIKPQSIGTIIADAAKAVGLENITGHSPRSGLATEARLAKHDAKTIAEQGGWSETSSVLYEYMRIVDKWADNATAGIGM